MLNGLGMGLNLYFKYNIFNYKSGEYHQISKIDFRVCYQCFNHAFHISSSATSAVTSAKIATRNHHRDFLIAATFALSNAYWIVQPFAMPALNSFTKTSP